MKKTESLAHFSYERSDKELMILDMQGSGNYLFDPEIASKKLLDDDNEVLFSTGNLSTMAINNFVSCHSPSKKFTTDRDSRNYLAVKVSLTELTRQITPVRMAMHHQS